MILRALTFCLFIVLPMLPGAAQDSHYWTTMYGTQSTLLGGAVVGSHLDISSTFYNPGALGIMKNPAFVMTGWVFHGTSLRLESAVGQNNDLASLHLSPAPDYITALIPTASKNKIAYTFLNRYTFSERLSARTSVRKDVLRQPGDELFSGNYFLDLYIKENWAGLTWSRTLNDRIGVGISHFAAFRSQRFFSDIHTLALAENNLAAQSSKTQHAVFYNFRLLWKIGLAVHLDAFNFGLAITTPSVNIYGRGSSYINTSITGFHAENSDAQDFVAVNDQNDLPSTSRSPLSVSFGASYTLGKTSMHTSLEWFDAINNQRILPTRSFISQSTGQRLDNAVIQDVESVINFGVGLQHALSGPFELYASLVTDLCAVSPHSPHTMSITTWDIYHLMAGALVRVWRSEITLGIGYSFGRDDVAQKVDFDTAHEDNLLFGELGKTNGAYDSLTLLAGFSIFPKELFQKTLEGLPFFNRQNRDSSN